MRSDPIDHRPDTRLAWGLGIVIVSAALAPILVALVFGDRLPAQVPRHYGADGRATATWPLWTSVIFLSSVTLLVAGGCTAAAVLLRMPLVMRRIMAWTVTWVAIMLGGLKAGALWQLVDVADPMAGGSISDVSAVALVTGLVLGIPVAALAREEPHGRRATARPPDDLPRRPAGQDLVWRSAPLMSRALLVVLGALGLLFIVPAVLVGPFTDGLWLLLLAVATLAPLLVVARPRVRIDADGLHVRAGRIGLLSIPIAEVARAEVVDHLDPFWEFGGWGLRVDVHGRTGIVSRAGEALRVVRADDTEVLITVDDARVAAATLNTWCDVHHDPRAA